MVVFVVTIVVMVVVAVKRGGGRVAGFVGRVGGGDVVQNDGRFVVEFGRVDSVAEFGADVGGPGGVEDEGGVEVVDYCPKARGLVMER